METELWAIGLVIITGIISGFGPIYLKKGADTLKLDKLSSIIKNKFLIIGILIYGLGTIMFIPALKGGEISVLYPFVSLSYVWIAIYSIILLKEKMTFLKWLGIAAIILGVSIIGFGA